MHSQTNICMGQPWLPVMKIEHGVLKNKNQIYSDGVIHDEVKFGTKYKNSQKLKLKILVISFGFKLPPMTKLQSDHSNPKSRIVILPTCS